ncbi:MAG: lysophospholipid acyltransferase family protein [Marinilabiliaceae bacterium]|nr:lysophospholipid acyltransferase family protein [Marinilabiliaceae bacterium]
MSSWSGKSKGTPLGYQIFIFLIKTDIRLAYFFLIPVTLFYFFFSSKRNIYFFYRHRLMYNSVKSCFFIYRNYLSLGKTLIDKIAILSGQKNKYEFDFEGEDYLHKLAQNQKGGLLLGAHMGNWEVAGELLERVDSVINILMVEAEHQKLKDVLAKAIKGKKVNIIPIKADMSHIFNLIEAFKRKELVAMHGDRFVEGSQFVELNFLNAKARFPVGPMVLAARYGIPVSFVFSLKKTNTKYHFYATQGKTYPNIRKPSLRNDAIKTMMADYVEVLEKMVREYPNQWFNYHSFWVDETIN